MGQIIAQRLILVVAGIALLTYAGRKNWLRPNEVAWVGAAMIFASTGWVLQAVLNVTIGNFHTRQGAILAAVGLTTPLFLALVVGLTILVKRLAAASGSSK
jgi:hypothetical protein